MDLAIEQHTGALIAQVVFHITVTSHKIGNVIGSELVEQCRQRLAQKVTQHIEATPVCHSHFNGPDIKAGAFFKNGVEQNHGALPTLEGKSLFPEEFLSEKRLKQLRLEQPLEDFALLVIDQVLVLITVLNTFTDPVAHFRVKYVHELNAHIAAISLFEGGDELAQLHLLAPTVKLGRHLTIEIGLTQPKLIEFQTWVGSPRIIQWIKVRLRVPQCAVIIAQAYHLAPEIQIALIAGLDLQITRWLTIDPGFRLSLPLLFFELSIAQFKALEKCTPVILHRLWVFTPLVIFLIQKIRIETR